MSMLFFHSKPSLPPSPKVQYPSSWMSWVMMIGAPCQATTNSLRILGYSPGDCNSSVIASSSKDNKHYKAGKYFKDLLLNLKIAPS